MPDESVGQPQTEEVAAPQVEQSAPAPELPSKFAGKTVEEVARSYAELERLSGKQAEDIGNLRNELSYLRGQVEQRVTPEPAPPPETTQEFDWQNPGRYMEAYFEKKWQAKEKERQEQERARQVREAQMNFEEGWNLALRQNPKMFAGLEKETRDSVRDAYLGGILDPLNLRKPDTFEGAAILLRYKKGNLKDVFQSDISPVRPSATEVPTAAKPQTDEDTFELNPELREEAQKWGLTEKEAQEAMKAGYKAMQEGRLRRRG